MICWSKREQEAWRPLPELDVAEWARGHLYLSRKTSSMPGLYRPEFSPYVIEPLRCFTAEGIEKIVLCWAAQTGKTTLLYACMAYGIAWDPGPVLLVMPAQNICDYTAANRIQPLISDCPALLEKFEPRRKWRFSEMRFDGGVLSLVGANSPGQLSSRPVRYLLLDETSKFPITTGREASPQALAEERTNSFPLHKIIAASTPVMSGDAILSDMANSDQRKYWVPCPHCGEYQILIQEQLRWPHLADGKSAEPGDAREGAYYQCVNCGRRIDERYKRGMLAAGKWLKRGETINKAGRISGGGPANSIAGFRLNALYSPFLTWGQLVERWLRSQEDRTRLQAYVNSVLAEPWEEEKVRLVASNVRRFVRSDIAQTIVPAGYDLLTIGADVHLNFVRYNVWAWKLPTGARHLVDNGNLGEIADLANVLRRMYPRADGTHVSIAFGFCDSRYRGTAVLDFCRTTGGVLMASRGITSDLDPQPLSTILQKQYPGKRAEAIPGGGQLVGRIRVAPFKSEMFQQLGAGLAEEPSEDRGPESEQMVTFHASVDERYLRSLTAEEQVANKNRRGQLVLVWVQLRDDNHDLDCSVYAAAAKRYIAPVIEQRRAEERQQLARKRTRPSKDEEKRQTTTHRAKFAPRKF